MTVDLAKDHSGEGELQGRASGYFPASGETGDPPWGDPWSWREANRSLAYLAALRSEDLDRAFSLAARVRRNVELMGPMLDRLCAATCPWCPEPCCLSAVVWLDFTDLLFLHLANITPPPAQLRDRTPDPCRYLSPHGCLLPRLARPWVCTWYLCPTQKRRLSQWPTLEKEALLSAQDRITRSRHHLSQAFIQATAGVDIWQNP
ncbi:MAG: hypothetical protein KKA60_01110 [Proteobacteria bacterium]|nr:hypothetical protein [Pseudomonadota bacterium]